MKHEHQINVAITLLVASGHVTMLEAQKKIKSGKMNLNLPDMYIVPPLITNYPQST